MKKSSGVLLILIFVGLIIGSLLGEAMASYKTLSFLSYGKEFGISLSDPFFLDLGVLKLKLGLLFSINIASILGVVLALFTYKLF